MNTLSWPRHFRAQTAHARRGAIRNAFRYGVDYVMIDPASSAGPLLFSRNRFNLTSVKDSSHGGPMKQGCGAAWAEEVFESAGLDLQNAQIRLLTQPGFLGYVFNPVSFWLAFERGALVAVIAEVTNTCGDRHSYLCHLPDFEPITPDRQIAAQKIFHVSPFQKIAGTYRFNFAVSASRIAIRILHENGPNGVVATLTGKARPLSNLSILGSVVRRPLGALRTMALIHWQALKLWRKGAPFRRRPEPPKKEVSQC
jgi:hypothetical protein